jgi:murein DD-endopeptidase MepM/ murein hydrolase activator NlpD
MKSIWWILFLLFMVPAQDEGSVEIYRVEESDRIELFGRNKNIYPVTVEIDVEAENLSPNKKLPVIEVIPPNSNRSLVSLAYSNIEEGWNLRTKYRYYMGDIDAKHQDSFAYRLPYAKGEKFRVAQGFGGYFSHQGDLRHSIDFDMPKGSSVYAARGGVVVKTEERYDQGGPTDDMMELANYITVLHDDGSFANYSHLMQNGVKVEVGQQIRTGQVIGFSGNTGYSTGPHLHFVVKKAKRGGGFTSIPVKFVTRNGIQLLEEGQSYIGY